MSAPESNDPTKTGMAWLGYAMITVLCFGLYGNFLHAGQSGMSDPEQGRFKAFLFVGIAYFLVAVLAPLAVLMAKKATPKYTTKGVIYSLLAGTAGAVGALGILLAFGAGGTPAVVMSIVFAGAPIINAFVSMTQHPPKGGWGAIKPQFYLGILLAATGGALVTFFKPPPPKAHAPAAIVQETDPTVAPAVQR